MKKLLLLAVYLALAAPCAARIITVDDDGPADFNNIQAAINDSNNGDVVVVFPGTYTGNGNRDIKFFGKAITVRSINPVDPCIVAATVIECNGTEMEPHRGFYFHSQEDANCILAGFTIIRGYGPGEQIGENVAPAGGAVYCKNSNPRIAQCVIKDSYAALGGGIFCDSSSPTLINCSVSGNSAFEAGGMYNYESSATLIRCTFTGNWAEDHGGGVIDYNCTPVLSNCTFIGNSGGAAGGGMANYISCPTLTNCTFVSNLTTKTVIGAGGGGGMFNSYYSAPRLVNCKFSGNVAGGGLCNDNSSPTLTNCTFSGNRAYLGRAVVNWWADSNPILSNCILRDGGDEIYDRYGATTTITYSNVQGGWPGLGNIDVDPCFVKPGKWVDANDPNITVEPNDPNAIWIDGDYHLKSQGWYWDSVRQRWDYDEVTSRCIDAGNPGSPLRGELLTIPDDPGHIWGRTLRINMGAYGGTAQASMPPYDWALLGDITNDGLINGCDFAHQAQDWLTIGTEQPGDLNKNGIVNIRDLALFVDDWLKTTTWHE